MKNFYRVSAIQRLLNGLIYVLTVFVLSLIICAILIRLANQQSKQSMDLPIRASSTTEFIVESAENISKSFSGNADQDSNKNSKGTTFSDAQRRLLNEIFQALRSKDVSLASIALKDWYMLWKDTDKWVDFSGHFYDGENVSSNDINLALTSDGITRFYYGSLENGVPHGQGVRIVLIKEQPEYITYFWTEGTWNHGVLFGNAFIYIGKTLEDNNSEPIPYVEIHCNFDNTPEEKMIYARILQQSVEQDVTGTFVSQFTYHLDERKLIKDEWNWDSYIQHYYIESIAEFYPRNGYTRLNPRLYLYLKELDDVFFQNPFPWGQPYRFEGEPLFNCNCIHYFDI